MPGELLPAGWTITAEGGHRWVVWHRLWRQLVNEEAILMNDGDTMLNQ